MSVNSLKRDLPSGSSSSNQGEISNPKESSLVELESKIGHFISVSLPAVAGYELSFSDANRLGRSELVVALLEKCFNETPTKTEALAFFSTEMKKIVKESWLPPEANQKEVARKVDEFVDSLVGVFTSVFKKKPRPPTAFEQSIQKKSHTENSPLIEAEDHFSRIEKELRHLLRVGVKTREITTWLENNGFKLGHTTGSHMQYYLNHHLVTVSSHSSSHGDFHQGTLHSMQHQIMAALRFKSDVG